MEQSYYTPTSSTAPSEARDTLGSAAAEFSKNVQEATGRLVNAAETFSTMSSGLNTAVDAVKSASAKAEAALKGAEEAKAAAEKAKSDAEAVQANIARDYGNLKTLMSDLQERIAALAVLARPLSLDTNESSPAPSALQDERSTENSSSGEEHAPAENAPSPAGWQGWQG